MTTTALAQRVEHTLNERAEQLSMLAPDKHDTKRAVRQCLMAMAKNPALNRCSQQSIVMAVADAVQVGLDLSPTLGQAYLVPYGQTCQLIIGYRGFIQLAYRSGRVKAMVSHFVTRDEYESGAFEWRIEGGEEYPIHRIDIDRDERLTIVAAYASATLTTGGRIGVLMSMRQIEAIKQDSLSKLSGKARNYSPWIKFEPEMIRTRPLRRLSKMMPVDPMTASIAEAADDAALGVEQQNHRGGGEEQGRPPEPEAESFGQDGEANGSSNGHASRVQQMADRERGHDPVPAGAPRQYENGHSNGYHGPDGGREPPIEITDDDIPF